MGSNAGWSTTGKSSSVVSSRSSTRELKSSARESRNGRVTWTWSGRWATDSRGSGAARCTGHANSVFPKRSARSTGWLMPPVTRDCSRPEVFWNSPSAELAQPTRSEVADEGGNSKHAFSKCMVGQISQRPQRNQGQPCKSKINKFRTSAAASSTRRVSTPHRIDLRMAASRRGWKEFNSSPLVELNM